MNHTDHVNLLRPGIPSVGGTWADFGAGTGAFTLALAELVGVSGHIYALDKDAGSLRENERAVHRHFPHVNVDYLTADFARPLTLPPLDGIVMANALHFHRDKEPVLRRVLDYLKPSGRLILIEYNVDHGNTWVPYPLSYPTWEILADSAGFIRTRQLAVYPSRFLHEIYSAVSQRPE
jgi:ubiquinone/menaquinone biosynthesis C-methylase UbiE